MIAMMEQLKSESGHLDEGGERPSSRNGDSLTSSSDDGACSPSPFPSAHGILDWCQDWKKIVWTRRSARALSLINVVSFLGVLVSDIIIFEVSTRSVRNRHHRTAIFPIYIANAAAFAFACKWNGSAAIPNFAGFFAGQIYITARNGFDLLTVHLLYLLFLSFIQMLEAQIGADFVRRKLCRNGRKILPTIDTVEEAVIYTVIVCGVSLFFETLAVILNCTTRLAEWSSFPQLWSTRWLAVLAAFLTVAPALIHGFAYGPRYSNRYRLRRVVESLVLISCTVLMLGLIIFSLPFTTVIRPLPYLLYPLVIFSVFRFNRLGWTLVVAAVASFGSWGSLHYNSSALYYTSGSSKRSSPTLILQLELFMSVLGVVAITLAGAVREKEKLTKDLHRLNQRLEDAVSKRTQELIKANKELQITQTHAEKANLAKSDFLANMSHEIRTPIHGILGLTALLLQTELSADQLENLVSVKDCADLLLHIINSILDLAKIEAGRLEVETVPFSIRKVVSGTLRMLQVRAKERGLQLHCRFDRDVPLLIAGDPGKLQQCLLNLVGNALKFTHKGSVTVHISLRSGFESSFSHVLSVRKESFKKSPIKSPSFPARLRSWASWPSSNVNADIDEDNVTSSVVDMLDAQLTKSYLSSKGSSKGAHIVAALNREKDEGRPVEQKEYVLIEVRDTGIGISRDIVCEMFNPFTQADASTSRLYGGTGLGLSIVQRFVELLGGKIWVESEIGKGSMFSFVVPFRRVDTKEDLKGRTNGSPQSPVAFLQPLPTSMDKPPRQKKSSLQRSTLGKGRRAHSLNTLMKNLKFSLPQFGDAEPLLHMTLVNSSEDSGLKQSPPKSSTEIDRRASSMPIENLGAAEKAEPSYKTENTSGISTREYPEPPSLLNVEKESKSSADPKGVQVQIAVNDDSVGVGKDHTVQPSETDTSLLHNSVAGHILESSSSASGGMTKGSDGYRDLEMGIIDTSPAHEKNNITSTEGNRISKSDDPLSLAATLSNAQPKLDKTSDAVRNLPPRGPQQQTLLPPKEKLQVLLAEDNMINQRVATRLLQKHGHVVTIVGDGLQALNAVRLHHDKFDLVLMDIQMPMMDGLQATERIRAEEAQRGWSRIPILGLTAHAISGYQETCLSHGMDAYLGKPFEINQLLKYEWAFIAERSARVAFLDPDIQLRSFPSDVETRWPIHIQSRWAEHLFEKGRQFDFLPPGNVGRSSRQLPPSCLIAFGTKEQVTNGVKDPAYIYRALTLLPVVVGDDIHSVPTAIFTGWVQDRSAAEFRLLTKRRCCSFVSVD